MSTSGLNPTGTLCFGANNTTSVSIGFDDAITIDNITAEISVNGTIYNGSGTQTDFTSLILSNAGFNPSGSLNIGTSNTSEITIGSLKIDNTVLPPQIYMNGVSLPPGSLTFSGDKFTLQNDVIQDNYLDPLYRELQFNNVNNSTIVLVDTALDGADPPAPDGLNNMLKLVQSGIYAFNVKYNINNSLGSGSGNIVLRGSGFQGEDGTIPSSGDIIDSEIEFTFTNGTGTLSGSKQFLVYTVNTGRMFTIYSYIDSLQLNKIGTEITINRIGDWPAP